MPKAARPAGMKSSWLFAASIERREPYLGALAVILQAARQGRIPPPGTAGFPPQLGNAPCVASFDVPCRDEIHLPARLDADRRGCTARGAGRRGGAERRRLGALAGGHPRPDA